MKKAVVPRRISFRPTDARAQRAANREWSLDRRGASFAAEHYTALSVQTLSQPAAKQSMAMARPIVASAISDLPALLEGCGRVVPPGDVDKLAEAISELLQNSKEAQILGQRARTRCLENFSMRSISAILEQVISRVLKA